MPKMNLIFKTDVHFGYGLKPDYSALERRLTHPSLWTYFGGDPFDPKGFLATNNWLANRSCGKTTIAIDALRTWMALEGARTIQKDIEDNPYQDKIERFLELTGELPEARSTRLGMKTPLIIIVSVTLVG